MPNVNVTVSIPYTLRKELTSLKLIPQEPYYSVIQRLIDFYKGKKNGNKIINTTLPETTKTLDAYMKQKEEDE